MITTEHPSPPTVPTQKKEYITYTKAVQTDPYTDSSTSADDEDDIRFRSRRRSSKRGLQSDEEIRTSLRKEIEAELRATQNGDAITPIRTAQQRFPLRTLND